MKRCSRYQLEKFVVEFNKSARAVSGLQGYCRPCQIDIQKYYTSLGRLSERRHGLKKGDYQNLLTQQNGVCSICQQTRDSTRRLTVDHDHSTGTIRGLLCGPCNRALGLFEDNRDWIKRAIAYLDGEL